MDFIQKYHKFFLVGMKNSVLIALFAVLIGVLFGVLFALLKLSKNKVLKTIATIYIEFIRGTPLLVQLYIIYYGLPMLGICIPKIPFLGDSGNDLLAGIITLSLNSTAYVAEIIRGGIEAVDKGQMEAARSLGLNHSMAMKSVIMPQAFKNILPALCNEFITIIKESSIVSVIGVPELMFNADTVRGNTFEPFAPLLIAAALYFIMTFTLSKLIGIVERRMKLSD